MSKGKSADKSTDIWKYVTPVNIPHDIRYVADRMRSVDIVELQAEGCTASPYKVLYRSCVISDEAYTAIDTRAERRTPVALFGVGTLYAEEAGYAAVWFLGTDGLYAPHNARVLLRVSRLWMDYFTSRYGTIGNEVHAGNVRSLRWLEWCGFRRLASSRPNPFTGELFYTMIREPTEFKSTERRGIRACVRS